MNSSNPINLVPSITVSKQSMNAKLNVALVYPPFGPSGLPSLGLALLSAGVKERGHHCQMFYWNFDLIAHMPGATFINRLDAYRSLTGRTWHPFNEWVFGQVLYGATQSARDKLAEQELALLDTLNPHGPIRSNDVLRLRGQADDLVNLMIDRVANYDVIGIATTFYQNIPALALAKKIKERWPTKTVVLGGANCDGEMGVGLMRLFGFLDYVFSGEVDHAFPEFVDRLAGNESLDDVDGLHRRGQRGEILSGPPVVPLGNLDALPLPDFDDFVKERQRTGIDAAQQLVLALESSRGCWWGAKHHCTFCGLNALGIEYRQKNQARFQAEVTEIVQRYGAKFLFMTDNILSTRYYDQFMSWAAQADLHVDYFYEMKANVNRSHIERLANARITAVQPGIESFSTKTLALMRKGSTGIQNVAFLKYAREYGVLPTYNILVGFPGEEPQEYEKIANEIPKLMHLRPPTSMPRVEYHRFSPYHETPAEFGIRLRPGPQYNYLYPFSEHDIANIAYVFVRDNDEQTDQSYIDVLVEQVRRWHQVYSEEECALVWWSESNDVIIVDQRPDFPHRQYRLKAYAVTVFHQMDAPRSLRSLVEEAQAVPLVSPTDTLLELLLGPDLERMLAEQSPHEEIIRFSAQDFVLNPEACLEPFVDGGLVYVESAEMFLNKRYLSLPIGVDRRAAVLRWLEVGV